jgi:transglutaminase-like putative cysteine protease
VHKFRARIVTVPAWRRTLHGIGRCAAASAVVAALAVLPAALALARQSDPSALAAVAPPATSGAAAVGAGQVAALVDAGKFAAADKEIDRLLATGSLDDAASRALRFERERMRRIRLDFSLDRAQAIARVRKQVPDLTDAEFDKWDAAGLLEKREIDGATRYFARAPSNLFRLSPEAFARRVPPTPLLDGPMERANPHHRAVLDAVRAGTPLPARKVRVTQSLVVEADAVPAGEMLHAWIPVPREIAGQQDGFRVVSTTPAAHVLAPASAAMRTVSMEAPARAGAETRFDVTYEVTVHAQMRGDAPPRAPAAAAAMGAPTADDVAERPPHIVFTDAMRAFSRKVVGDETDPWRITQKLYAAVDRIPWAGALEYSTIPNISDYALHAGHADCGQQTLLLMTLLRLNGIPARWQSGMVFSDGDYDNLHDWGWVHVAPWGWIPMDVTTGRLDDPDPAIAGFYLGGLDAYRLAFNDDYGRDFVPAKQYPRSDTVDSQRGEVEWRGGNLYYDQWDYTFVATPQP